MTKKAIKFDDGYYHEKHKPVMAWWFCDERNRLGYCHNDIVSPGKKIEMMTALPQSEPWSARQGPVLCEQGMHASKRLSDAFWHEKGFILWRVKLEGDMNVGRNKIAARYRTHLASVNILPILLKVIDEFLIGYNHDKNYDMYVPLIEIAYIACDETGEVKKRGIFKKFWARVEDLVWKELKENGYEEV